jgi:cell division protein FtsI/penicillin-binding protein 2
MTTPTARRTRLRAGIVGAFFLMALVAISVQAFRLHIFKGAWLSERAARQYEGAMVVQGKRGAITDRNGSPLAVSIDSPSIAAYPRQVTDRSATAKQLAGALGLPQRDVYKNGWTPNAASCGSNAKPRHARLNRSGFWA